MKRILPYLLFIVITASSTLQAQMIDGVDTLYGDEWIDYEQTYYKMKVVENGMYRISNSTLVNMGLPMSGISGTDFQLFAYGEEVPLFLSTSENFGEDDFIEFYGVKNKGYVDRFLYKSWSTEQLNPDYSLFNDTMAYFLTWNNEGNHERYETIENNLGGNLPEVEAHYTAEKKMLLYNSYVKASFNGSAYIRYSNFDRIEGYGSSLKSSHSYNIEVDHISPVGNKPKLKLRTGSNHTQHHTAITINDNLVFTNSFSGYKISELSIDIDQSMLSNNNKIEVKDENPTERTSVSSLSILYPRTFHANQLNDFSFSIEAHGVPKYFRIQDFNITGSDVFIYDSKNNMRLQGEVVDGNIEFVLPASVNRREIHIYNAIGGVSEIGLLKEVVFQDYNTYNPDYVIISSERLNSESEGENQVLAYADYRRSIVGGDYEVEIVNVENLYDQFGYGINRHSLSIRNFSNRMFGQWGNWEYVFIIGKGLSLSDYRKSNHIMERSQYFHVPTYGKTSSDNLLFSKMFEFHPQIAVGRLAVVNGTEIKDYLDKVKAQNDFLSLEQSIKGKLWNKNILHLGGGDGVFQQNQFKANLNELKSIIENNEFGGSVRSFFKTSSDVVQSATSDELIGYIDEGVSIISFLGHSSVGSFDFNIEQVDAYHNKDKYPILISMGCYSGNIHKVIGGLSQDFVLKKDKGVIAFIASGGTAYASNLMQMARGFYGLIGEERYGGTIGSVWQQVYNNNKSNANISNVTLLQQNTLHGDPAIRLYPSTGSDFMIDYESLQLDPKTISSSDESYELNFDIVNLGRGVEDSIYLEVLQVSDEDSILYSWKEKVLSPRNRSSFQQVIPITNKELSIGKNKILINIDTENDIAELPLPIAEQNNKLLDNEGNEGYRFYIVDNNIKPIYPIDFGIVNGTINLYAGIANLFVEAQSYVVQLDTNISFVNPIEQTIIHQGGGLLRWSPSTSPIHEQVYYWRVSPDSIDASVGYLWSGGSFVYHDQLDDGWNQSHPNQLQQNEMDGLVVEEDGLLSYEVNQIAFRVMNRIRSGFQYPQFIINNSVIDYNNGVDIKSGVYVIVADDVFATPWVNNKGGDFGSDTPISSGNRKVFPFVTTTIEDRIELLDFLEYIIPDGYNVILMNIQSEDFPSNADEWEEDEVSIGRSIFTVLEDQGAEKVRLLNETPKRPYVYAYRKNHSVLDELIAEDSLTSIDKSIYCTARWFEGAMVSPLIGPATSWNKLKWSVSQEESDSFSIMINYYDSQKKFVSAQVINDVSLGEKDLGEIVAKNYPYLQLKYYSKDIELHTSPQLEYWRIYYDGIMDLALDPIQHFLFHGDTLQQGETMKLEIALTNVSNVSSDSIPVEYLIKDELNNEFLTIQRIGVITPGSSKVIKYDFDTKDLKEDFSFSLAVNKENNPKEKHQFNNILLKEVILKNDGINPLLYVRFDGVRISNDEFVSYQPDIRIELQDDNNFLVMNDPNKFVINLTKPSGERLVIDMLGDDIIFEPGTHENNKANVNYRPKLDQSGFYILEVSAKDASGNIAGDHSYYVRFQVLLEQSISNVLNYPNPFSTSTQFVFQLGGTELPSSFFIRIMTLSGKIVKEITAEEFGPLKLGLNKSNFYWNGRDDYGAKLANGVYLYQVNVKDEKGDRYKKIESDIDGYFKNGWGKLTILR